jgi:hypothetical protein
MQLTNQRLRLAVDTAQMGAINDVITGNSPMFWNGVDLQFELAFFRGAALADITNLASITVDLKTSLDKTSLPLMSATLSSGSFDMDLLLADWQAGDQADCHALITFTAAQANLFLTDDAVTFWLVINALTGDSPAHKIVLGATPLTVVEGGAFIPPPASVAQPFYYTAAQSDARYQLSIDLTTINNHLALLDTEMTAVTTTANAALPKAGGTISGTLTITGLTGVLKGVAGVVTGGSTTTDLTEGTNLYFTNARADARITAQKGAASGLCPLDSGSLIPTAYLPALAVSDVFVVASQAAMLALSSAHQGDVAIRTDINQTFILSTNNFGTLGDWKQMLSPTSAVTSVNSQTGAVVLTTTNIAEGANLYYTTARAKADAIAALLTGFSSSTGGTVSSGDSVLSALGKFENRMALNDAKLTGSDRVKIDGTTPMTGMLNFTGTTHAGLQLNNLTDAQRAALSPTVGMLIYNTTTLEIEFYNGTWITIGTSSSSGALLNAAGAPGAGLGNNGDYYINTTSGDIYLKSSGTWSVIVAHGVKSSGDTMTGPLQFSGTGQYGLRLNNLTSSQVAGVTPQLGAVVYNSSIDRAEIYLNGSGWTILSNSGSTYPLEVATASIAATTGNTATTTAYTVPSDGLYRMSGYLGVHTVGGADTVTMNFGWTNTENNTNSQGNSLNTTSLNVFLSQSFTFMAKAGTNITYAVNQTGSTAAYFVNLVVERLAP